MCILIYTEIIIIGSGSNPRNRKDFWIEKWGSYKAKVLSSEAPPKLSHETITRAKILLVWQQWMKRPSDEI